MVRTARTGPTSGAFTVRRARAGDVGSLRRFYEGLGDTSSYYRFFGIRPYVTADELRAATRQRPGRHVTLVAADGRRLVGVAEYRLPISADAPHLAVAVADDYQRHGVATALVAAVIAEARAAGWRRLIARTLPGNVAMQAVLAHAGVPQHSTLTGGVLEVELDLTVSRPPLP